MPIIISAPHGGNLEPDEIPDRTWGDVIGDPHSIEYAREVAAYTYPWTGRRPHIIINHLDRIKMDANREIGEAAHLTAHYGPTLRDFDHCVYLPVVMSPD